jgi:hypothetical protein
LWAKHHRLRERATIRIPTAFATVNVNRISSGKVPKAGIFDDFRNHCMPALLQSSDIMADWKQITARIRRARGSKDPAGQLTLLYEKTKDAMVAFELGRHFEIVRDTAQALQWYQSAYSRFRRGEWKTKSSEAIVRLGGEVAVEPASRTADAPALDSPDTAGSPVPAPEAALRFEPNPEALESLPAAGAQQDSDAGPAASEKGSEALKRRRRGRRGGRNRGKKTTAEPAVRAHGRHPVHREPAAEPAEIAPPRSVDARSIPRVPVEQLPESLPPGARGRFGDPGLSSRLSLLEMHLRRLLICPAAKLDHTEHAPAGPGVFVLTDDDMTTYYRVDACDSLRIGIGTFAKTGSARRGNPSLKPLLAENLGIPEARVSKYLADHCVVRWLQLDEGAPEFAHFAVAVLRPILNE